MPRKILHAPAVDEHIRQNLVADRGLQVRALLALLKMAAKLHRDGVDIGPDMREALKEVKRARRGKTQ